MRRLTSPQNGRVKLGRQLQKQNEARQSEGLFVAEGLRLTDDFLRAGISASFAFIGEQAAAQKWHEDHRSVECIDVSEAMMPIPTSAAIRPYSIAVAPDSSFIKSENLAILNSPNYLM